MSDEAAIHDEFSVASVYAEMLARAPENAMEPRLEPMRAAMDILGEPHRSAKVIHVAGTNGKTSTARMIEALLLAHELRVGRYTSPHMGSVTERIAIDGHPVSDDTFVRIWDEIRPFVLMVDEQLAQQGEVPLTLYEVLTVLAFAVFADAPVDVVVVEVGLGGLWDATNVVEPDVAVVTPVSLDHTELLGDTVEEIAAEKAGIIKPGGFLVSSAQEPEVADVLLEAAQRAGIPFRFEGVEFGVTSRQPGVGGQQVSIQGISARYEDLLLPVIGAHQAQNLAVAVAAVEAFLGGGERALEEDNVSGACAHMRSPGRLEVLRSAPAVIVDAAHNPAGIQASAEAFAETFGLSQVVLVVGILQEKDARAMVAELFTRYGDVAAHLCVTESTSPRAIPAADLADLALDAGFPEDMVHAEPRLDDALAWAVSQVDADEHTETGGVLVTGSITVVGEVRSLLGITDTGLGVDDHGVSDHGTDS